MAFPPFALRAGEDVPGFEPPGDVGFDFGLGASVSSAAMADLYLGANRRLHAPHGAARMSGAEYLTDLHAPPADFPITQFREGGAYVLRTRDGRLAAVQVSGLSSAGRNGRQEHAADGWYWFPLRWADSSVSGRSRLGDGNDVPEWGSHHPMRAPLRGIGWPPVLSSGAAGRWLCGGGPSRDL